MKTLHSPFPLRRLSVAFLTAAAVVGSACGPEEYKPVEPPAPTPAGSVMDRLMDQMYSDSTCALNADESFAHKVPPLGSVMQRMEAAPLTGAPVRQVLADPANGIESCIAPDIMLAVFSAAAAYDRVTNVLYVGERTTLFDFSHESFHAAQDAHRTAYRVGNADLGLADDVIGRLLGEAAAVGYTFVLAKEMDGQEPGVYAAFVASEPSFGIPASVFDGAYDAALAEIGSEKKALEAGGRAVTRGLLHGVSSEWTEGYLPRTLRITGARAYTADIGAEGYGDLRNKFFLAAGRVSEDVNITPPELLGRESVLATLEILEALSGPKRAPSPLLGS